MDQLPMEIIVHIFQYLSKEEQIKISKVNKKFREALFSPSLWTEHEKRLEVLGSQLKSLMKFLKQTPWLRYLHFKITQYYMPKCTSSVNITTVNLTTVFKPLKNLECHSLKLDFQLRPRMTFLPSTLKHISLDEYWFFITNIILIRVADSCPQLEHIQIKSFGKYSYSRGLAYLLKKVEETLQTLILIMPLCEYPARLFLDCPPNLTTFCLDARCLTLNRQNHLLKLPNLENLQILIIKQCIFQEVFSIMFANCSLTNLRFLYLLDDYYLFNDEDCYEKFAKLPNLQILYLANCLVDIDVLVRFVTSLKVLAWKEAQGYSKRQMFELEKLKKETQIKIYLCTPDYGTENNCQNFPTFPNKNFDCLKTFHYLFDEIFDVESPNCSKCHAPFIQKCKALLGI